MAAGASGFGSIRVLFPRANFVKCPGRGAKIESRDFRGKSVGENREPEIVVIV